MKKKLIILFLFIVSPLFGYAQNALPSGFAAIKLGNNLKAVKDELQRDRNFIYRGEPDVTMLETPNRQSIEVTGAGFIRKAFFLFFNDQLHTIILELRTDRLDYSTLFNTLLQKYGEASNLTNLVTQWEDNQVRLSLERPLVLKYTNIAIFDSLMTESQIEPNTLAQMRQDFLNSL